MKITKNVLRCVQMIFPEASVDENGLLLIYRPNMNNLGLLINLEYLEFKVVHVITTLNSEFGYEFDQTLYNLFSGKIHIDKSIVFEFECMENKNGILINNKTNLMSSLRPIFDTLNYNGIAVCLTFRKDIKKIYYMYNNNSFWSPLRKKTFSCNQKDK